MKKPVTVRFIRFENKIEKITIESAIDLLIADHSHNKYTRKEIKAALESGCLMQLENVTLQMVGIGCDSGLKENLNGYDYKTIEK